MLRLCLALLAAAIRESTAFRTEGLVLLDEPAEHTCWSQVDSLSDFSSLATMEAGGWLLEGFTASESKFGDEFEGHCVGSCAASLKTTLRGQGHFAVVIENVGGRGTNVRVTLAGQELAAVAAEEEKVVEVTYQDAQELMIAETEGVIRLKWLSCVHKHEGQAGYDIGVPDVPSPHDIGRAGVVDGLYPHAAPPTAWPPFRNPLSSDGCWPGVRTWTTRRTLGVKFVDTTPQISGWIGCRHPYMEAAELNVKTHQTTPFGCSERSPNIPRAPPTIVHDIHWYVDTAKHISPLHYNLSVVGVASDGFTDVSAARDLARQAGWRVVGHSYNPGNWFYIGWSSAWLYQQPDTRVCMLTFMGSKALGDWVANFHLVKGEFCGLPSRVHKGFRNKFRNVVQYSEWQENIRPKLSKCAQVLVVGHSLGGACAEMFAACNAAAPGPQEDGHEDYKHISWIRGVPELLPEL